MAMLGQFLHVPRKFSMIGLGQEDEIGENTLRPEIWWHDAVNHETDHCMKWLHSANVHIFWSRLAEGAVVLWMSCFRSGPVFYLLSCSPSHLEYFLQITWPFSIFTPSDLKAKSHGEIPSDFSCWLGAILGCSNIVICILFCFKFIYVTLCSIFYNICSTNSQLSFHWWIMCSMPPALTASYATKLVRGLLRCCIQWCHYSVDEWRHNGVDPDTWRCQQCITRRIGCVPK